MSFSDNIYEQKKEKTSWPDLVRAMFEYCLNDLNAVKALELHIHNIKDLNQLTERAAFKQNEAIDAKNEYALFLDKANAYQQELINNIPKKKV